MRKAIGRFLAQVVHRVHRCLYTADDEIMEIVGRHEGGLPRDLILEFALPPFTQFEIDYTIDKLVAEKKLITDGNYFLDPIKNPMKAQEMEARKEAMALTYNEW